MISHLFRTEALEYDGRAYHGEILMARPLSLSIASLFAAGFLIAASFYLYIGEYTQRAQVSGFLAPASGFIRIASSQSGVIQDRPVSEGSVVHKGDVLFTIASDRETAAHGEAQASMSRQIEERKRSLRDDLEKQSSIFEEQKKALSRRIATLREEVLQIDREVATQRQRVDLAAGIEKKYRDLRTTNLASPLQIDEKLAEVLDQRGKLEALERNGLSLRRDLASAEAEQDELPLRQKTQFSAIEREIALAEQELTESEARRQISVTAPRDGVVSALVADIGQTVNANQPLCTLLPQDLQLEAQLYAPSKSIGFVREGQMVALRYQAYPFQQFGHQQGQVTKVSQVSLSPAELPFPVAGASEAMYRITVKLNSQTIRVGDRAVPLQPGMAIDADVLLNRQRLVQWLFEPLANLKKSS